jgi:ribosome assembly protein SQT1
MVFYPPPWVPALPFDPPDSIPISEFIFNEKYGRYPLKDSRPFFTCGLSGESYTALECKQRVDHLARGLAKELGWSPNSGTEWDKVIGVCSVNTVGSTLSAMQGEAR